MHQRPTGDEAPYASLSGIRRTRERATWGEDLSSKDCAEPSEARRLRAKKILKQYIQNENNTIHKYCPMHVP